VAAEVRCAGGIVETAEELTEFLPRLGSLLRTCDVVVVSVFHRDHAFPRHIPFVPGLIHGQHHLGTMTALTAWPGVPGMYFFPGVRPFDEQPPRHPRLRRYLTMAAINGDWLAEAAGVEASRVVTVPNWFDLRWCRWTARSGWGPG
jgi:hypothetical protein